MPSFDLDHVGVTGQDGDDLAVGERQGLAPEIGELIAGDDPRGRLGDQLVAGCRQRPVEELKVGRKRALEAGMESAAAMRSSAMRLGHERLDVSVVGQRAELGHELVGFEHRALDPASVDGER